MEPEPKNAKNFGQQIKNNAVVLVLLFIALAIAFVAWQIDSGIEKERPSAGQQRQGVDRQLWIGKRGPWYYGSTAYFWVGKKSAVSEDSGVITISGPRGLRGLITMENLELEDNLYQLAKRRSGEIIGRGVLYPGPNNQRQATALVGGERWEISFRGPGSAKIARAIIRSANPRQQ